MKWEEVRKLYPNQFVKFQIIESHIIDDKKYVDEIAFIKAMPDGKEAMEEFRKCKGEQFVYSTVNEELIINLVRHVGIRRGV
ncbi:hypothetical protein [Clostridium sp. JN-9]|uniref:hypothetical protein n=1 Tax=Clostridium sp. JN-9 TaxID=2507159 RepID=UPI000FFDF7FA|nr:hypothetical protein [Clostridium sp. JN-9]QAT40585.1 hypothetical protein EQM05_10110 [Clostridium sp. JN-9]